jgi:hypothetical protein
MVSVVSIVKAASPIQKVTEALEKFMRRIMTPWGNILFLFSTISKQKEL